MDQKTINEAKDNWLKNDFVGGAIICDFIFLKHEKLDLVYDLQNNLVQEYKSLLECRLKTNNFNLILMVNVEIECCYLDKKEEIYRYLNDEVYEHFINNHRNYSLEAVGLHIDIIRSLFYLGETNKACRYIRILKETYQYTFGSESYLFCKNWSYILNEIFLEFLPQTAIKEFSDYIDLFSRVLREETILYSLCINVAIKKTNLEQKADYVKEAVDLCEIWCKDAPAKIKNEFQILFKGLTAIYYRNIGNYDLSIEKFMEVKNIASDIHTKLFYLSKIAEMLYLKRDINKLYYILEESEKLISTLQEPNENVVNLYNIYALYYAQIGQKSNAQNLIKKAVNLSELVSGKYTDDTIKIKCNELWINYNFGIIDETTIQMQNLADIVLNNPEQYPESLPTVLNNLNAMSFDSKFDSNAIHNTKKILELIHIRYDIPTIIVSKCNLYLYMTAVRDIYGEDDELKNIRDELTKHFNQYPDTAGYLQYLEGEYFRASHEGNTCLEYKILNKIETYLEKIQYNINTREYLLYFMVKLKNYLFRRKYTEAKKWLMSLWDKTFFPLFSNLTIENQNDIGSSLAFLQKYISLFISSVLQYPQLNISEKELFEFVLNYKYFIDLVYYEREELNILLSRKSLFSVKDININTGMLIIECFYYTKYDLENFISLLVNSTSSNLNLICFSLTYSNSFFSKYNIEVITDIPYNDLCCKINDIYKMEEISQIEIDTWNKLQKFLTKIEKIYICNDSDVKIPLSAMKITQQKYWGELYPITYCDTAKNIKTDVEIENFSNSIFFGMSVFENFLKKESQKILLDLPWVEPEIKKLGNMTKGSVYLDKNISGKWLLNQKKDIMHFASHTDDGKHGDKVLIIGKKNNEYIILRGSDIAKFDWHDVKLVILSGCVTDVQTGINFSLSQGVKKAGAIYTISTLIEVSDGTNTFFMICFYKKLLQYKKIEKAFFETQKTMSTITKKEILADKDYLDIYMDYYLENFNKEERPFEDIDSWAGYILRMN